MTKTYSELLNEIQKIVDAGRGDEICATFMVDMGTAKEYFKGHDLKENEPTPEMVESLIWDLSHSEGVWDVLENTANDYIEEFIDEYRNDTR